MSQTEQQQLEELCQRLGADAGQARRMAAQMIKRSQQIAVERGIERTEAMRELIELLIKGRNGEV
ncbi:MAG: hypothetical protein JJU20_05095 [Opitutales bacterium]|nr:hypothetical protein [Opitutales bacterium]